MDGVQERLNASVQRKLSAALALAILAMALVAGACSFLAAYEEAHELQDDALRQVARVLERQALPATPAPGDGGQEAPVLVQRLGTGGAMILPLPATLAEGWHTLDVHGLAFRVLVRKTAGGERIAVAQALGFRNDIARDGALRTVAPLLVLVPLLLLIVARLVRSMFRPIATLAREIDARAEDALHPVEDCRLPLEVRPFAVAINRLLGRVGQAMAAQRRFVADAAHELRSPLSALSLQAERVAAAGMSALARERLQVLQQGIMRAGELLDQLLSLARAQAAGARPQAALSIQATYRRVLADLMPLAEAKDIDIGIEGAQDVQVVVAEMDLLTLVRNLADNAIRYTPPGGRVDLAVGTGPGCAMIHVRDNGPGIPPQDRERVFDPFYRRLGSGQAGSGLGLAIVRAIAERMGATIRLDFADEAGQRGLSVTVTVPVDPAAS